MASPYHTTSNSWTNSITTNKQTILISYNSVEKQKKKYFISSEEMTTGTAYRRSCTTVVTANTKHF